MQAQEVETTGSESVEIITEWLMLTPPAVPLPYTAGEALKPGSMLGFEPVDIQSLTPAAGQAVAWSGGKSLVWQKKMASAEGSVRLEASGEHPQVAYLAVYLRASRFSKVELQMTTPHMARVYLNGEKIAEKSNSDAEKAGEIKQSLKLETGTHLLVVKSLRDPDSSMSWEITAKLSAKPGFMVSAGLSPERVIDAHLLLDRTMISGVSISPDGQIAAVSYRKMNPQTAKNESWLRFYDVKTGNTERTFRGGTAISGIDWAPNKNLFAYTDSNNGKTTLWLVDLTTENVTALLRDVEDLGGFSWAPNGEFIVYSITEKPEKDESGVKKLQSPRDRWPSFRNKYFLYRVNIADGTRQRLTAGNESTYLNDIHPNGRALIFSTTVDDFSARPYTRTAVLELNLETLAADTLFVEGWIGSTRYSPDGNTLLVTGSARAFGNAGVNLPEGVIPNDYDTQAYLINRADGKVTAFTKNFDPAISSARWSAAGKHIYIVASEGEYERLFRYSVAQQSFEKLPTNIDVVDAFSLAAKAPVAIYHGTGAQQPDQAYIMDLRKKSSQLLSEPARDAFKNVRFGALKDFRFVNQNGATIEGRVYYPPDFDPAQKYPAIVYYYGGTSVTDRSFGGRYPKNLYAAQGYIVYVLQPSGATGYGQAFSALHVNDWGKTTSQDILLGVEKFLAAHPFVDPQRLGCIGASYGGFMTMHLLTRSDRFAAAISHAGISALSSYWGEGYWGYLYSAAATAESFPWNRRDIYVDQSPLFNADKVTTPLLLLHGDSDTNVPPGESDQFYLALKLLGKTVEYVSIAGQDHHILDYKKRLRWQDTIFAWFDKWLKDQPEWWDELYPEKK